LFVQSCSLLRTEIPSSAPLGTFSPWLGRRENKVPANNCTLNFGKKRGLTNTLYSCNTILNFL